MKIRETAVHGAFVLDLERLEDERGWFARTLDTEWLTGHGMESVFVQHSISFNPRRGTLRGFHYQADPAGETKIVRCTSGAIHDVIVDLRPSSPTFMRNFAIRLDASNHSSLYVPQGCAHGFLTLEPATEVLYLISKPYRADLARGLRWNDPALGIEWPFEPEVISERDAAFPSYEARL